MRKSPLLLMSNLASDLQKGCALLFSLKEDHSGRTMGKMQLSFCRSLSLSLCMHACMHARTDRRTDRRMHAGMYLCIQACRSLCACVCVQTCAFAFAVRAKLFLHLPAATQPGQKQRCTAEQNGKFEHEMSYRCGKALDFEAGT